MRSKFSGDTVYLIEPHDDEDAGSSPAADPENPDTANPSKMNSLENPNFPAAAKGGGNGDVETASFLSEKSPRPAKRPSAKSSMSATTVLASKSWMYFFVVLGIAFLCMLFFMIETIKDRYAAKWVLVTWGKPWLRGLQGRPFRKDALFISNTSFDKRYSSRNFPRDFQKIDLILLLKLPIFGAFEPLQR